ncbi:Asp23/Gls24 family envelope stress response protein [Paenibacillus kandeliae]|uniref:Asp23/Gls24 family envelope stress response protein n=1 Tax=Paenibacillus kandeliae TaxID=3231269 RepID=UPI00345833F1
MAETRLDPTQETVLHERKNSLTFEDQVIQKIAALAANEVPGVLSLEGGFFSNLAGRFSNSENVIRGVDVEVGEKQVALDLVAVVEYGKSIPAIFNELIKKVSEAINRMTGLEVVEINLNIVDVKTRKEFDLETKPPQEEPKIERVN